LTQEQQPLFTSPSVRLNSSISTHIHAQLTKQIIEQIDAIKITTDLANKQKSLKAQNDPTLPPTTKVQVDLSFQNDLKNRCLLSDASEICDFISSLSTNCDQPNPILFLEYLILEGHLPITKMCTDVIQRLEPDPTVSLFTLDKIALCIEAIQHQDNTFEIQYNYKTHLINSVLQPSHQTGILKFEFSYKMKWDTIENEWKVDPLAIEPPSFSPFDPKKGKTQHRSRRTEVKKIIGGN
jgi:hypothetical protein